MCERALCNKSNFPGELLVEKNLKCKRVREFHFQEFKLACLFCLTTCAFLMTALLSRFESAHIFSIYLLLTGFEGSTFPLSIYDSSAKFLRHKSKGNKPGSVYYSVERVDGVSKSFNCYISPCT